MKMKARFLRLKKDIMQFMVTNDELGLKERKPVVLARTYEFATNPQKLDAFKSWFQERVDSNVFAVDATGQAWTNEYVESAYKKGMERAYFDANKAKLTEHLEFYEGSRAEFLRSAFFAPETTSKVKLLYSRAYNNLKGITDAMSQQISSTLAEGLVRGDNPLEIARRMTKTVDKLEAVRARALARTEIIHAHAEGQLDAFEKLGVEEVGLMVEWSTAGDGLVCEECEGMNGEVFKVSESHGLIPLHPNCRCAWIPSTEETRATGVEQKSAVETYTRNIEKGVSTDYSQDMINEYTYLSKKFPNVAKRIREVRVLPGKTGVLADAGKPGSKIWRITLNKKYFGPNSKYDIARGLKLTTKKGLAAGKGQVSEVMTHEFGHMVMRSLPAKTQSKINEIWWEEFWKDGRKALSKALGKYSTESPGEMFAEAFINWHAGKSNAFVRKMMKLAKVKGKPGKL